jgi:nicotinamide mononucleotide adenylyltransferase
MELSSSLFFVFTVTITVKNREVSNGMTVGIQMHQTLAGLQGAAADLKTYALQTQDQNAKQMFISMNQQLESMCEQLKGRVNYIEKQEPQYKMK